MRAPASMKREFLKKWILGLKAYSSAKQHMNFLQRKKAIKLSADIAIACTRNGRTCWSRALVANASKNGENKGLVAHILAPECDRLKQASREPVVACNKRVRSNKILKKSCCVKRRIKKNNVPQMVLAKSIAKRMIKKRTQVLKNLVPGGEFMDDVSLIEETLDYIVSLRAQVDVMRSLARATELLNNGK